MRKLLLVAAIVLLAVLLVMWLQPGTPEPPVQPSQPTESIPTQPTQAETQPTQPTQPTAAPTTQPTQPPTQPTDPIQDLLDTMTLEEKVYQLFIVTHEQLTGYDRVNQSGGVTQAAIEEKPVGGIIYFSANLETREQCKAMISGIQSYSKIPLFIAVDEEGGMVARVANTDGMGTTKFPNMGSIETRGEAYDVGYTIGAEIAELGFNLDFAPVADVNSNPNNPVIGKRAFSSDAQETAALVSAAVQGFRDSGTLCTLKHFPGHGDTQTDSHLGYTEVTKTLEELRELEFVPFAAGTQAGAAFVMVGHLAVPEVTGDDTPATLSKPLIDLLRTEVGFEGLVITDSMQMQAITDRYTSGEAAVAAIEAGVDVILMPDNLAGAVRGLLEAVEDGRLSEARIDQSVYKILETKAEAGIL